MTPFISSSSNCDSKWTMSFEKRAKPVRIPSSTWFPKFPPEKDTYYFRDFVQNFERDEEHTIQETVLRRIRDIALCLGYHQGKPIPREIIYSSIFLKESIIDEILAYNSENFKKLGICIEERVTP